MKRFITPLLLLIGVAASALAADKARFVRGPVYSGMADASGAVAVGTNLFIVADDEDNILRLYRSDLPGAALNQWDCNAFLRIRGQHTEADLEAAARIGDRAFWMGSHGRNKNGRERPNRGCLFATDIKTNGQQISLTPVGQPYRELLPDLNSDARFSGFHLAEAALRAPKEPDALNIEGLCATPEGHLLIGFRNPIPEGKALVIPMLNPNEVIQGNRPVFGAPIQLDLNGLGIRDMALYQKTYVIIGGSYHGGGKFELFTWDGRSPNPERVKVKHLNEYHPEAIIIYPDKGLSEIQILSDDGTEPVEGVPGKEVKDPLKKSFRSFWVEGMGR